MLEYIGLGLAYLFTGYTIGKIANSEYYDDTPNEDLGLIRRFKRTILFPFSSLSDHWRDRDSESDAPELRLGSAKSLNADNESKEKYCMITTFLWPFKLIPAVIGLGISAGFVIGKICSTIYILPSTSYKLIGTGVKTIDKTRIRLLPSKPTLSSQIYAIEDYLAKLKNQRKELRDKQVEIESEIRRIKDNVNEWNGISYQSDLTDSNQKLNMNQITTTLNEKRDALETERVKMENQIGTIDNKIVSLSQHLKILTQCRTTLGMGISITAEPADGKLIKTDTLATLASDTISLSQRMMTECETLLAET